MTRAEHSSSKTPVLRLGTRRSNLALTQSTAIARALERAHRAAGLRVELVEIATHGDHDRKTALKNFGGVGVFVKELEQALLDGSIDLAVHSLKDVPTRQPTGLVIAAIPRREDVRDVLVLRRGAKLDGARGTLRIGSGSPRRQAQMKLRHPHLRFADIRGNVETRLRKVRDGAYDGTLLARAGLKRLGLLKTLKYAQVLSATQVLPAPGQGALGIECRSRDRRTKALLAVLHDDHVAACVDAERACLAALGGGCHLPLGAHAKITPDGRLTLRAVLALPDGSRAARAAVEGTPQHARALGRKAGRLIARSEDGRDILMELGE